MVQIENSVQINPSSNQFELKIWFGPIRLEFQTICIEYDLKRFSNSFRLNSNPKFSPGSNSIRCNSYFFLDLPENIYQNKHNNMNT